MTSHQSSLSTDNKKLHARLASLADREREAGASFDVLDEKRAAGLRRGLSLCSATPEGYAEADALLSSIYDEMLDAENGLMAAPIDSRADVVAKVHIIVRRAEPYNDPDLSDLIEEFADQLIAFGRAA